MDVAELLPRFGWSPVFQILEDDGELKERAHAAGIPVLSPHAKPWLPKSRPGFYLDALRTIRTMARQYREERIDVMISFLFWSSQYAVPAARRAGVRGIITSRLQLAEFKRGRPHYQVIENYNNRHTHAVMVNTLALREETIGIERIDPSRVCVIYNGVDLTRFGTTPPEDFASAHPQLAGADPLVVMVANLKPIKRHDVLLRAIAHAASAVPGIRAVLVGDDHGERSKLESLARDLKIADRIAFAGTRADTAPAYAAAPIAALTSDGEGLPNAVLEAMASGCAVVATRVGGIPELIAHEESGLLVEPGDWRAAGEAFVRLAKEPGLRSRLVQAARARVRSKLFTPECCARAHAQLFDAVYETGRPPRGIDGGPLLDGGAV